MASNYPNNIDNFVNPNSSDSLKEPSHAKQHADANNAIIALQSKVGVDNSTDENSIDYKLQYLASQLGSLNNNSTVITELLGLDGNNDQVVTGIENKTLIDSFAKAAYATVKYTLQLSYQSKFYTSDISILNDNSNLNISESNIISNTSDILGNISFEETSGIISLYITPVGPTVNVRYYRTALKQ